MRLQQLHPSLNPRGAFLAAHVDTSGLDVTCDNYGSVTLEQALDMTTGRYTSLAWMVDEDSYATSVSFFGVETHQEKLSFCCEQYPVQTAPGSTLVYHTPDTYLLGTAMTGFLRSVSENKAADLFDDVIVPDIFSAINMSETSKVTRRTYDSVGQMFTGWGLTFVRDDVAKLALLLNSQAGSIGGEQVLDVDLLNGALFRNSNDMGLPEGGPGGGGDGWSYNNGMWGADLAADLGCTGGEHVWGAYASGYGGIAVALFPNGINHFYFSDGAEYAKFTAAAVEAHKIIPMC